MAPFATAVLALGSMKRTGFAPILLLFAGGAACGPPSYPVSAGHSLLNTRLPEIHEASVNGADVDSREVLGHPVVIKFFAKSCAACRRTLPNAERLHEAYRDVAFIGVSEDDDEASAEWLIRAYDLHFPVILDAGKNMSSLFRVGEIPTAFVADRRGVIRWVGGETQSGGDLRQAIEAAR